MLTMYVHGMCLRAWYVCMYMVCVYEHSMCVRAWYVCMVLLCVLLEGVIHSDACIPIST